MSPIPDYESRHPTISDSLPAFEYIRNGLVGGDDNPAYIEGPFGQRKLVYTDYVASGRGLTYFEDYIQKNVLPLYGNTHSHSSATGRQTTAFREEARSIIANATNASDDDVVIFTGSGASGAIYLFHQALLKHFPGVKPLIVMGPYEHNSNRLMWRELEAEVVCINERNDGGIDTIHLEKVLSKSKAKIKIGTFSAASNVTGILTDTVEVTKVLHKWNALACWDYAAAAPYCKIEMNPPNAPKDAIFISTHKLVGGPGAPGILVVKKKWMQNQVPVLPGGGTVEVVHDKGHKYLNDIVEREEGGTPNIIGAIRAGLAFGLKQSIGDHVIHAREQAITHHVLTCLSTEPTICVLGTSLTDRLPTFSFLVRRKWAYLHYEFVTVLLNDLFGIQSRGGCACAGPYTLFLLGVTEKELERIQDAGDSVLNPGFTRFSLPYFVSDITVDYVISCVKFIGKHGWRFLPLYGYDRDAKTWVCRVQNHLSKPPPKAFTLGSFLKRSRGGNLGEIARTLSTKQPPSLGSARTDSHHTVSPPVKDEEDLKIYQELERPLSSQGIRPRIDIVQSNPNEITAVRKRGGTRRKARKEWKFPLESLPTANGEVDMESLIPSPEHEEYANNTPPGDRVEKSKLNPRPLRATIKRMLKDPASKDVASATDTISDTSSQSTLYTRSITSESSVQSTPEDLFKEARRILADAVAGYPRFMPATFTHIPDEVCWFLKPEEALFEVQNPFASVSRPPNILKPVTGQTVGWAHQEREEANRSHGCWTGFCHTFFKRH